jgi:hypothetical protein
LQLPRGCHLIQATVAGVPGLLYPLRGANQWQLILGPDRLPQTIRVVYAVPGPDATHLASPSQLMAPVLKGVPVDRTLWTVFPRGHTASVRTAPPAVQVSRLSQELTRLQTGLQMMNLPADVLAENTPGELMRWYRGWARNQAAVRHRIDVLQRRSGVTNPRTSDLQKHWEAQQQQWAARLDDIAATGSPATEATRVYEPMDMFATMTVAPVTATHVAATGGAPAVSVRRSDGGRSDVAMRLFASICLAIATTVFCVAQRRGWITDFFFGHPQLAGVLVGLAWWLWLTPSLFGWIIVIVSLIPSVRHFPVVSTEPDTARMTTLPLPNGPRR